jgi:hypothetical protein
MGFVLRLPLNDTIPPRWDEGWSIAHASLGLSEILVITAADVHPPLYYLLLGLWQHVIGIDLFAARYLSVLMSVTAIPLAFVAGKACSGSARLGVLAAIFMAWLPLGVYYGAVVRMYALAPSFVLLAMYGAAGLWSGRGNRSTYFIVGAVGAMYTLYHAAWALTAIGVFAVGVAIINRQATVVHKFAKAVGLAILLYLPWLVFAAPQFLGRAAAESATNIGQQYSIAYFIQQGILDLTMAQQIGDAGPVIIGTIIALGIVAQIRYRRDPLRVLNSQFSILNLTALIIVFTLTGVAFAARQWAFNARMLICAAPALALALAWAFEALLTQNAKRKTLPKLIVFVLSFALAIVYLPTSADFVYRKSLEVFDPYNPNTYRATIVPHAQPNDHIFFNVLSPAGFYALDHRPSDPDWSYALTWDPVIEPQTRWRERIQNAAQSHHRLWLALYRGGDPKNGDLRGFMDSTYFPAFAQWGEEEVFYGLYGAPRGGLERHSVDVTRWGDIELTDIRVGTLVRPGDVIPVALTWRASTPIGTNYKVFVHAVKADGFVVAQHDAQPLNDLRPTTTWPVNEDILDHHGLALPPDFQGEVTIRIGLYDPVTGERLRTTEGPDAVEVAKVTVQP